MWVLNKQLELLQFVFDSINVYLQYYEISLTFTAGSVHCVVSVVMWSHLRSVCEVVVVPYVDAVVAVTVMCVLLFVLHVCMLRECEGTRVTTMLVCGDGGVVSAGHVGGTRGSSIVSRTANMLGMGVVREMRGVGGVCGMCLARGSVGGEGASG